MSDRTDQGCRRHSRSVFVPHDSHELLIRNPSVRTAAIIAGGQAQRLGGLDKSGLSVGGRRILDRQLSVLRHVAEHILVVSNDHHRLRSSGLRVCSDLIPAAGPLGGLYTALARSPTAQTLVVASDLPFLTVAFLSHLAARMDSEDAVIPHTAVGAQPLCAMYDRACLEPIRNRLERSELRLSDLIDVVKATKIGPAEVAPFDPEGTLFFNVNTQDDYTQANALATRDHSQPSLGTFIPSFESSKKRTP